MSSLGWTFGGGLVCESVQIILSLLSFPGRREIACSISAPELLQIKSRDESGTIWNNGTALWAEHTVYVGEGAVVHRLLAVPSFGSRQSRQVLGFFLLFAALWSCIAAMPRAFRLQISLAYSYEFDSVLKNILDFRMLLAFLTLNILLLGFS